MATLTPSPRMQFFDANGDPLAGGKLYTYAAGSVTPLATYTDSGGGTANANPVILDSRGQAAVWLGTSLYKFVLHNSAGVLQPDGGDNIGGVAMKSELSASSGSSIVGFIQAGSGAVARTGQSKMREAVSVLDFGAVADGDGAGAGTNNSAFIQAAHDAILATGTSGVLHIPAGIYRCNTGLSIDASVVRIESDGALLDFTNLTAGVAITIGGGTLAYAGNPFFNAYSVVQGLKLKGNSSSGAVTGVYYYDSAQASGAHSGMRDCSIYDFGTGIEIGANSYILSFDHVEVFLCGTCVNEPTASNAGERITFNNCAFYNSTNGFALTNAIASTFINHCSIDGMSELYFYITAGHLSVTDCHIEGNFSGTGYYPNARLFWNDDTAYPSYSYVTFSGCHILVKVGGAGTVRANPVFGFDGAIFFTMLGGYISATDGATVGTAIFGDDGANAGAMKLLGTFIDNGSNPMFSMTGVLLAGAFIALGNRDTLALGTAQPAAAGVGISFPAAQVSSTDANTLDDYEEGTFTPTVVGSSTAGTATYTRQIGRYTKIGNRVLFSIDLIWNTGNGTGDQGVAGLPFASSNTSMLHAFAVAGDAIALTAGSYLNGCLLGPSETTAYVYQSATGTASLSSLPYDAAGELCISGHYFV